MGVEYTCCEAEFFIHIAVIVLLVLFAGLMSGLTLGLMSLSLVDLEVLAKSGTPKDQIYAGASFFITLIRLKLKHKSGKKNSAERWNFIDFVLLSAAKILPVVKNQHLLLCTLLICNAAAMEVVISLFIMLRNSVI